MSRFLIALWIRLMAARALLVPGLHGGDLGGLDIVSDHFISRESEFEPAIDPRTG